MLQQGATERIHIRIGIFDLADFSQNARDCTETFSG